MAYLIAIPKTKCEESVFCVWPAAVALEFFCLFVFVLASLCGMKDLRSRPGIEPSPWSGSAERQPLDRQGIPCPKVWKNTGE